MSLRVSLFNLVFGPILFIYKILYLVTTVLSGFALIRLQFWNPFLSLFYAVIFVAGALGYLTCYNLAYSITQDVENLKAEIMVKVCKVLRIKGDREKYKKIIKSVPEVIISVGGFYPVERECTIIFLNFVVQQIISLLLTF